MKVAIVAAAAGIASASHILPRAPAAPAGYCCFTLTANAGGYDSAVIEEDTIGQNRIFGEYPDGFYCIDPAKPGKLFDIRGLTCIISKTSKQFQCTSGLTTEVNFSVSDDGDFQADGSDKFWACRAGPDNGNTADGSFLIYSDKKENPYGCMPITLSTTGNKCAGAGEGPISEMPYGESTTTVTQVPTPKPSSFTSFPIYGPGSLVTSTTATVPASSAAVSSFTSFPIYGPGSLVTPSTVTVPASSAAASSFTSFPIYGPGGFVTSTTVTVPASSAAASSFTSFPIYGPGSFVTSTTVTVPASSAAASSYPPFDIFSPPASSASGYVPVNNEVPAETPAGYPFDTKILPLPTTTVTPSIPADYKPTSSSAGPSATPSGDGALLCPPLSLIPGFFRAPALIIPVSSEAPDAAYGTQFVAQITPGNSTLFSFDIPADWEGSSCSVIFTFATQENTAFPGAWKFSGHDAKIQLSELKGPIDQSVTFATTPKEKVSFNETSVTPGGEYRVATEKCRAGSNIVIKAESVGETAIEYFQATGPKAIGVWITLC